MQNAFKKIAAAASEACRLIKEKAARFTAWQRKGVEAAPLSPEAHVCLNCHERYAGNFCPRCGQSASVARFTLRHALSKTLEVWGLGNRSLPRTLWHLVYRPGHMIGDYLDGRQAPFFPPVKMLFLVTAAFVVTQHIVAPGVMDKFYDDATARLSERKIDISDGDGAYQAKQYVLEGMDNFTDAFNNVTDFFRQNQAIYHARVPPVAVAPEDEPHRVLFRPNPDSQPAHDGVNSLHRRHAGQPVDGQHVRHAHVAVAARHVL